VTCSRPTFARDPATAGYYEQRAGEYDEWYLGHGRFASRDRPGWAVEVERVVHLVQSLPAARTLDVACGSGFLTRHLRGLAVALDQSRAMVALTQSRLPAGVAMIGDALDLPFADGAFDRVLTGHFYGHLPPDERQAFLAEARRVAKELIVIDSAVRPGVEAEQWQERVLNDGSRHRVYKRYLAGPQLADELGGQVLLDGTWFIAARASWPVTTSDAASGSIKHHASDDARSRRLGAA
jgi:SAM-dependent methyltransferase